MVFKIDKHFKYNIHNKPIKYKVISQARRYIVWVRLGATEQALEKYLIKYYNTTLKIACLYLLTQLNLYQDNDNTIVIKFNERKAEQLARLITFGNGKLTGSDILLKAFNNISI